MKNNYILICTNESEPTTDVVCDWLNYLQKPFIRISYEVKIAITNIIITNNNIDIEFVINEQKYLLSEIKSYWYRRSKLGFESIEFINEISDFEKGLNLVLPNEFEQIKKYFKIRLNEKAVLNKEEDNFIVKLDVLYKAKEIGLKIPDTIVTKQKSDLDYFKDAEMITKAIGDIIFETKDKGYGMMTNKIEKEEIESDIFFPTLFQSLVDKKLDIRSFFFNGTFYTTSIFSQNSDQTKVDFRNYNREIPNRIVPYKLPDEIEAKLILLMDKLDLKSGSIDLAYTHSGEYVFFEVNPVGQFEQVSMPGNFNLFKNIALCL